jgi:hypothetical protein
MGEEVMNDPHIPNDVLVEDLNIIVRVMAFYELTDVERNTVARDYLNKLSKSQLKDGRLRRLTCQFLKPPPHRTSFEQRF